MDSMKLSNLNTTSPLINGERNLISTFSFVKNLAYYKKSTCKLCKILYFTIFGVQRPHQPPYMEGL